MQGPHLAKRTQAGTPIDYSKLKNEFDKIQRKSCTIYIHKNFRNTKLEKALESGEQNLREHFGLEPVSSSKFARVYKFTAEFDGVDRGVYFKQYLCRSAWDSIKHLFRPSRAKRAFKAAATLAENGFNSPIIIAMGQFKSGFFDTRNFLVTLEVENAKPIYQYIPDNLENPNNEQLRNNRKLIRTFGKTIGKLHAKNIFHGDLRAGNVLAVEKKNNWEFFFLDNERTRKFCKLPPWLRLKNLVQTNMHRADVLTNSDRMRFFKAYLEQNPTIENNRKTWAAKIALRTALRLQKKQNQSS